MKPLMLSIQAFGPFVNKEEIDFTQLGSNPLFLINGPTGSGKSTILDAICFALYGKTTGADREAAQMRCDQSDDKMLTTVTLDFILGEKSYRVSRSPTQFRAKARGEGLTEHAGEANLWSLDSVGEKTLMVAKKLKDVSDEIENITGLDVDQFRQVMVLPQGKFRDLLLADSADREKIFSKLFQTNIYKRIEENLKHKAIKISSDKKDHDSKIKGILISADLDSEEQVSTQLKSNLDELDSALKHKNKMNQAWQDELSIRESAQALLKQYAGINLTKQEIEEAESLSDEIETKKTALANALKADKLSPYYVELKRVNDECEKNAVDINDADKKVKKLRLKNEKIERDLSCCKSALDSSDALKNQVSELRRYEKIAQELVISVDDEVEAKRVYELSHSCFLNTKSDHDKLIKRITLLEQEKVDIQHKLMGLNTKQLELSQLDVQLKALFLKESLDDELVNFKQDMSELHKKRDELAQTFEQSKTYAKQQELSWHMGQAAVLAMQLQDDSPCPVCGSKEHPLPADVLSEGDDLVSKDEVDSAREEMEKNRLCMQAEIDQINKLDNKISTLKNRIDEVNIELGDFTSRESSAKKASDIENELKGLKNEIDSLEKDQLKLESMNQSLIDCNRSVVLLSDETDLAQTQLNSDELEYKLKQAAVEKIKSSFPENYHDASVVIEKRLQLETDITCIKNEYEHSLSLFDVSKVDVTKQQANYESLTSRKGELALQSETTKSKWRIALEKSNFNSLDSYKAALIDDITQNIMSEDITEFNTRCIQLKASLEQQLKLVENKSKPDLKIIEETCIEKQAIYKIAEDAWKNLDARVNQLNSIKAKLKKSHEKSASLEAEYAIYGTLSLVANGRTGSNISLQRFVLSVLLDDVLIEASRRLSVMSKGRFKLLRKLDKSKGNKASGLELDVEDAYTGKTRSVATLSGGESFMAALALALGLSDVVQAYAGGIKLDTLFIDEGFGSLDQESLDLAIRTLIDLQATGRMIGIISHVSELKEQMSLRLDVVSSKTGSKIKLVAA